MTPPSDNQPGSTAWTPGPWHADFHMGSWDVWQLPQQVAPIALGIDDEADAKLIALAPEMAVAIRDAAKLARIHGGNLRQPFRALIEMDDRLRKIGGAS